MRTRPPESLAELYTPDTAQEIQVRVLSQELQRHDLDASWESADEMVTQQRVNRTQAFRHVYVNAFDLPFNPSDYQRLVRNKAIEVLASAEKPDEVLKAVRLLGDTAPVQAFVAEKTINLNINKSSEALRDDIRAKLEHLLAANS
jgi:hypothetical protein